MAACTSRAAPLMSRLRSNCSTIAVEPRLLVEVISVTAAMCPNCRSSGAATEVAIVSGLAPGSAACTWMVGKSTWGSGATGKRSKASTPLSASASVSSVVAIGRLMNGSAMLIAMAPHALGQSVEGEVNDRRGVERQRLADDQPAHDGQPERTPQLAAHTMAQRQRQGTKQRRQRRHHDRPEAQ